MKWWDELKARVTFLVGNRQSRSARRTGDPRDGSARPKDGETHATFGDKPNPNTTAGGSRPDFLP